MPARQKSVRTIVAEIVMFVGMFAVVGNAAINFWERFTLQRELVQMKTSLHSLKFAVNNIGTAYDNLYKELQDLVTSTEYTVYTSKPSKEPYKRSKIYPSKVYNPQKEVKVQTAMRTNVGTALERSVRDFIQECKLPSGKNVSTLTRYPLKSTAIGQDDDFYQVQDPRRMSCVQRCYNHEDKDGSFKRLRKY